MVLCLIYTILQEEMEDTDQIAIQNTLDLMSIGETRMIAGLECKVKITYNPDGTLELQRVKRRNNKMTQLRQFDYVWYIHDTLAITVLDINDAIELERQIRDEPATVTYNNITYEVMKSDPLIALVKKGHPPIWSAPFHEAMETFIMVSLMKDRQPYTSYDDVKFFTNNWNVRLKSLTPIVRQQYYQLLEQLKEMVGEFGYIDCTIADRLLGSNDSVVI